MHTLQSSQQEMHAEWIMVPRASAAGPEAAMGFLLEFDGCLLGRRRKTAPPASWLDRLARQELGKGPPSPNTGQDSNGFCSP